MVFPAEVDTSLSGTVQVQAALARGSAQFKVLFKVSILTEFVVIIQDLLAQRVLGRVLLRELVVDPSTPRRFVHWNAQDSRLFEDVNKNSVAKNKNKPKSVTSSIFCKHNTPTL